MSTPYSQSLPPSRPRCPKCGMRMVTTHVWSLPVTRRFFECLRCGHRESQAVTSDPTKPETNSWLSSELGGHNCDRPHR